MLKVHNLACVRNAQVLFAQLHFQLSPGEILHVTGANGSGKSSLLLMLLGLLTPQCGAVYWQDELIQKAGSRYHAEVVYIGHKIGVKNQLTVEENLQIATQLGSANPAVKLATVLQQLGLQSFAQRLCLGLSAGQRQRVALARLFLLNSPLWILDEPLTAIDGATTALIERRLQEHVAAGGMVVLTSHQALTISGGVIKQLALGT